VHIIIGMPPHIIMHGIPLAIIDVIIVIRSFIISIIEGSIGIILQIMPSLPISQVILHIIGIMPMPIIGICIIMGMPIIIGFMPMPIIIGFIMGFIPIIIGFIMGFIPIIGIGFIIGWLIGIAFIMVMASYARDQIAQVNGQHAIERAALSSAAADGRLDRWMNFRCVVRAVRRGGCHALCCRTNATVRLHA
jgi:hypothetical protein